jgi:hypothetical protein
MAHPFCASVTRYVFGKVTKLLQNYPMLTPTCEAVLPRIISATKNDQNLFKKGI